MDEFEAKNYILEKGKNIESIEELTELIKEVESDFNNGYGIVPRAIGSVCAVVGNYLSYKMGITGFQAGCAMFDFITGYLITNNKCGLKLIDFDEMLYPQYEYKFDKKLKKSTWELMQKRAKELLEEEKDFLHPAVKDHWESIAQGKIPFGYSLESDNEA